MRFIEVLELCICFLAVLGLYALFVYLVILLGGGEGYRTAILAEDKSLDEIFVETELLRLRGCGKTVVLLEKENEEKENALRKEGFLVYVRKTGN